MDEAAERPYSISTLEQAYTLWRTGQDYPALRAEMELRMCQLFGLGPRYLSPIDPPRPPEPR